MKYKQELKKIIEETPELMTLLQLINTLGLKDWALCAGTIRNLVWCQLTQRPYSILQNNIDVLYSDHSESYEQYLTKQAIISQKNSTCLWNFQNAALNAADSGAPYGKNLLTAISSIPETCSAVGIRLENMQVKIIAPYGLDDLFNFEAHPTSSFMNDPKKLQLYRRRMLRKNWPQNWSEAIIFDN